MELGWLRETLESFWGPLGARVGLASAKEQKLYRQTQAMKQLLACYASLRTAELLDMLEAMHNTARLDIDIERGTAFHEVAKRFFARAPLGKAETSRLVAMLAWEEFRSYPSRWAPVLMVNAIIQNPCREHVQPLEEHIGWLRGELRNKDEFYRREVWIEIQRLEEFIEVCQNYWVSKYETVEEIVFG